MGTFYDREIEFLKGTGTQYIDTGVTCSNLSKVEIKVCSEFNSSATGIFGCRSFTPNTFFSIYELAYSGSYLFRCQAGYGNTYYTHQENSLTDYTVVLDKNVLSIDGNIVNTFSESTFTCTSTALLFAVLSGTTVDSRTFQGKIYYCKIWENDILVRDFIPVRVGNVGYMFDRVSCQLFGNAGTGSFVLGPDIYDARVEFLQSSGTQYINTGINYDSSMKVNMGFNLPSAAYGNLMGIYYSNSAVRRWYLRTDTSNKLWTYFGTLTNKNITISTNRWYDLFCDYRYLNCSSTYFDSTAAVWDTDTHEEPIYIFAMHDRVVSTGKDEASNFRAYKLSYFKVYIDDVLVRNFIPVRKGQVGYLYDKVSNQLFGNAGTGNFTLGNDVADIPSNYDEEVEYITFDGSQSIDTGLYGNLNTDIKVTFKTDRLINMGIFGAYNNGSENCIAVWGVNDGRAAAAFGANTAETRVILYHALNIWCKAQVNKDLRKIEALNATAHGANTEQISNDLTTLNTMRIGGFDTMMLVSYNCFVGQISAVQILQNGVLVRDYIPVRKDGVGYLYDRVTQKMFGNEYNSSFGIGHDKVRPAPTPSMKGVRKYYLRRELMLENISVKPYITNGLVFQLDGADYNDTDKTWASRVGNWTFPMTNTTKSADGLGVYFNGNATSILANFSAYRADTCTLEVVYEKTGGNASVWNSGNGSWIGYRRSGNNVWIATGNKITVCPSAYGKVTHAVESSLSIFNGTILTWTTGSAYYTRGTNSNAYIGRDNNNGTRMVGTIYQVRIYNRRLTTAEILYNQRQDKNKYGIPDII